MEINIKKDRPSKLHWWHGYKALGDNDPKDITSDNNEKMPFNLSVQCPTFQCPEVLKEVVGKWTYAYGMLSLNLGEQFTPLEALEQIP